jgi:TonB-linked SusC/RagA family outer membrane protein
MRMLSSLGTLCLFVVLWAPPAVQAQATGTITGVVTSQTGQPLAGVQVSIPGTARGALTRSDGQYLITGVPAGQHRVRATRVGYGAAEETITLAAGQTATVDFQLTDRAVELEEVVAVGYGVQHRQEVTGAVASVSPTRLENVPNTSVAQAIQGAVAGVNITAAATGAEPQFNILIRGQNSITASNDPLVVVDGIPYNGNLAEINQSDITSIDVLKDASATAIYGARGANGVILITTKQGQIGRPSFRYEGYVGMQEVANKPRLMTGPEFAVFKCERLSQFMSCEDALSPTERRMLESGSYTDWIDLATRRGTQQQHTLSVSGGSEETRFYISGSALGTQGVALNDEFRRYTLRTNLTQKLGSWMDLGLSTQLAHADRSGVAASFSGAYSANPLVPAFEEDGRTIALTPWPEDPERPNPLQNLNITDDDVSRRGLASGYAEARLPFLAGLSYRINGGFDFLSRDGGSYWPRTTRIGLNEQGRSVTESQRAFDWTVENLLRYTHTAGAHSVDMTVLYGVQGFNREDNTLLSSGFPNDVLTYRQGHLGRNVVPSYEVLNSGLVSQMGRLNYGYGGRYLVTLTARRDGFSGFGANYKYGVFPSVALAWNISNEPFWAFERFNELKLRLSYGQNGNQAIQPYQTLAQLAESSYLRGESTRPGFIPATLGNENLRWETTTSLNTGVDFRLFANRVWGSLDFYSSDTHDLLLDRLVSPVHGIPRMVDNVGRVRNRGIELGLSGRAIETARFSWTADFNISANRNRIVDLYGDGTDDLANQWFIGRPINTNFGFLFDGVWQEGEDIANSHQPNARPGDARVRDVNGDGRITADDRTFLGTEDPSYIAGLSNTLRYGSFSLGAFLHAVQGVTRYNDLLLAEVTVGHVRLNTLLFEYWSPQNPINTRWANRDAANPYGVGAFDDASFIRLRDLTLSYDLPAAVVGRLGAGGFRLFANGRNLWTHSTWTGMDPELDNQRIIPLERVFTVGVNARF